MKNTMSTIFCAGLLALLAAGPAGAHVSGGETFRQASAMHADAAAGAYSGAPESAVYAAGRGIDGRGRRNGAMTVDASGATVYAASGLSPGGAAQGLHTAEVPAPAGAPVKKSGLPSWALYGGGALLGGISGFFSAGLMGAAAGAGMGLASAFLFQKGDVGGAFGVTAGAMVGMAVGGPIGAVLGGLIGGLLGHFLGKMFIK